MEENEKKTKAPLGDRIKASGKKLGAFLKESLFKVFFISLKVHISIIFQYLIRRLRTKSCRNVKGIR